MFEYPIWKCSRGRNVSILPYFMLRYEKFFILCLISSHPRVWGFFYFKICSAVIPKCGDNFFGEIRGKTLFFDFANHSWNVRQTFFRKNIRVFLSLGLESSTTQNIRKTFFEKNIKDFFIFELESSISRKIRNFCWENKRNFFSIDFFIFQAWVEKFIRQLLYILVIWMTKVLYFNFKKSTSKNQSKADGKPN